MVKASGYCNGGDDCCSANVPCNEGEGDCDEDAECAWGLRCGTNNCPWGDGDSCCYMPRPGGCTGGDDCCSADVPCDEGEGDCDEDSDCAGGLKCGSNNCPWGDGDDCCYRYATVQDCRNSPADRF